MFRCTHYIYAHVHVCAWVWLRVTGFLSEAKVNKVTERLCRHEIQKTETLLSRGVTSGTGERGANPNHRGGGGEGNSQVHGNSM